MLTAKEFATFQTGFELALKEARDHGVELTLCGLKPDEQEGPGPDSSVSMPHEGLIPASRSSDEQRAIGGQPTALPWSIIQDYVPATDSPLQFVCVNIHVFQNSSGGNNFNYNHTGDFRRIFEWINGFQYNTFTPDYGGICNAGPPLAQGIDTRIRYVLNRIEFYHDEALNTHPIFSPKDPLFDAILDRDPKFESQLNIFITSPPDLNLATGIAVFPSTNMAHRQFIHSAYLPWSPSPGYFYASHWAHELGHVFNLSHLYDSNPCNESNPWFHYDIFGCGTTKVCPLPGGGNNNVMGGGSSASTATSQIAKMHHAIQELSCGKYVNNCCGGCAAFGARFDRHQSAGNEQVLEYLETLANTPEAWDRKHFTCPNDGIYHFDLGFQKDSLIDGGTSEDVWVRLIAGNEEIGIVWSEKADRATGGGFFSNFFGTPQSGRRDNVSLSVNVQLKKGTVVKTVVGSHGNLKRHLVNGTFSGHVICNDCCGGC